MLLMSMKNPWARATKTAAARQGGDAAETQPGLSVPAMETRQSPVRLALIVASSALLGGITLAIWNRRILEGMRRPIASASPEERAPTSEGDEFI